LWNLIGRSITACVIAQQYFSIHIRPTVPSIPQQKNSARVLKNVISINTFYLFLKKKACKPKTA
jgi:hypothetical protein